MPTLSRLELWSDYQYAGGTRQAILPVDHCIRLQTTERVERDDAGFLEISKDMPAAGDVVVGRVVRFLFSDASFTEWRIRHLEDASRTARIVRASLQSPLMELATGAAIISETTSNRVSLAVEWKALTPSEVLTNILAFCPSGWSAGTVDPTIPVNLTTAAWMPLRALRELVSAIRAQGVSVELSYRRNGTTGYYVDLVSSIGSSAGTLDVRTGKNLLSTTRERDRDRYALEVVPVGANNATMARAWIEVTAKSGTTLTVQAPVTGGQVIAFDGQWDGLYWIDDAGARQLISNSGVDQQLDVASAANVTAGRWYRLALNSSGDELVRVRKAPATAGPIQVAESSALDDTTNFVKNAAMRVWTGAASVPPDDWTTGGSGTITRTTTTGFWVYGGKSLRLQNTLGVISVTSPSMSIYVPAWATTAIYSAWIRLGSTANGPQVVFLRDGVNVNTTSLSSYTTGAWHRIDYTYSLSGLTGATRTFTVQFGLSTTGGAGDMYCDAAQVTFTSSAQPFVEGSNATRLLTLANRYLTTYSDVPVSYSVAFADLGGWDAASWPYDTVALGMTANVRDTELDITTSARVREVTRDWRNPLASTLTVANRPPDLVSLLSGIA